MSELSQHENIIAVINNSTNILQIAEALANKPEHIEILCSQDKLMLLFLAIGGSIMISICANIVPRLVVDLLTSYISGANEQATQIYQRLLPLARVIQSDNTFNTVWSALKMMDLVTDDSDSTFVAEDSQQLNHVLSKLVLL